MIEHMMFGLNSMALISGAMVFGMLGLLYMKFKNTSIKRFIFLHLNLLILIINFAFRSYMSLHEISLGWFQLFASRSIEASLFFTIPYFMNALSHNENGHMYQRLFSSCGVLWILSKYIVDYAMHLNILFTQHYFLIISWLDFALVIPIIYFIYQAVKVVKNGQEHADKQKVVSQALILVGVFLPGIFADLAWVQLMLIESIVPTGFYFSSLFFLTFNCFVMFGGIKYLTQPIHSRQYFRQQCSRYNLTEREEDICSLLLNGQSNSAISDQLFIELSTVKKHIQNIFKKTNTSQRFELIQKLRGVEL